MLSLDFKNLNTVLCLGAHADDIEVGCGGTILRLVKEHPHLSVWWAVFGAKGRRAGEAKASARAFLKGAGKQHVVVKGYRDGFFPSQGEAIKECFEKLKGMFQPDLVFTHYRDDRHQDHRVLSDLAWNTFRNHVILEYEIPKYDGDLGTPNFFVPLGREMCRQKVEHLTAFFQTQGNKHWFSSDAFLGLMRLRGIECASRYAEAFYCRKLVV
jgi:LmbE family N-acetylglucosaminyl deacetylase